MWLVLQHEKPEDFVVATGEVHSVREFVVSAFQQVGINIVYVFFSIFYLPVIYILAIRALNYLGN